MLTICGSCGAHAEPDAHFCVSCGSKLDGKFHGDLTDEVLRRALSRPESRIERYFFSKIAGVSHLNRDGSSRQEFLKQVRQFEPLEMILEPDNPVDLNAVKIVRQNGQQLGYLDSRLARETINRINDGENWGVILTEITGGSDDQPTFGANIAMCKLKAC